MQIDAVFGLGENETEPSSKYIQELRQRIAKAHELATEAANKARLSKGRLTIPKSEVERLK